MILRNWLSKCHQKYNQFIFFYREWRLYWRELISFRGHLYVDISIPYCIKDNFNWGDDVNKVLVSFISGKDVVPRRCMIREGVHYLCIGSIIQWHSDDNAIIWGSGLLTRTKVKGAKKICAVRGPLTRNELLKQGYNCPEIYGDPALLFPRYYSPSIKKQHRIGIIAHFYELKNPQLQKLLLDSNYFFIDIQHYGIWSDFINNVLSCDYIVSSSLHGCIISDAYNVPNMWCQFTEYVAEDAGFKFHDYYQSFGKDIAAPYNLIVNKPTEKELISMIDSRWSAPTVDIDLLMSVCPFKKK